jgi:hypothetical protein
LGVTQGYFNLLALHKVYLIIHKVNK